MKFNNWRDRENATDHYLFEKNEFTDKLVEIKKCLKDCFYTYTSELGIETNELDDFIGDYQYGFNNWKSFVKSLKKYLYNFDIIYINDECEISESRSNHQDAAALIIELEELAEKFESEYKFDTTPFDFDTI